MRVKTLRADPCESDAAGKFNPLPSGRVLHGHTDQFLLLALSSIPDRPMFTGIALAYGPDRRSEIDLSDSLAHLLLLTR